MDKIYRRTTQSNGTKPKPKVEKNRKRNVIMNFRISPEEKALIDKRITLSGLTRAEYFIHSCMNQKIEVVGNIKTFGVIKAQIAELKSAISKDNRLEHLDKEEIEGLKTILEILNNVYGGNDNGN